MKDNQYKPLARTYIVQEQPIKKSNLSVAARNKVINKTGSNYQSQNSQSYGPCLTYNPNCACSEAELRRQRLVLENREIEERTQRARGSSFGTFFTGWTAREEESNVNHEEHEELRQQIANLTIERDNRPNTSQAEYNNLLQERDRLQQQINNLNRQPTDYERIQLERDNLINRNQQLEDQQITEFTLNLNSAIENNFEEIEKKVKSLKKLIILYNCRSWSYGSCIILRLEVTDEWVKRIQNFINQNVNLTHLDIGSDLISWKKEHNLDFSKLTKLVFLLTPLFYREDGNLDLKENKDLEILILKRVNYYCQENERMNYQQNNPELNNLKLKENKKLKCLAFINSILNRASLDICSLNLSENKELEYIDIRDTNIKYLDLDRNEKITKCDGEGKHVICPNKYVYSPTYPRWEPNYESGFVSFETDKQSIRLA